MGWARRLRVLGHSTLAFSYVTSPVTILFLWALRQMGTVANRPLWQYAVLLLGGSVVHHAALLNYRRRPDRVALHLLAASGTLATAVVTYSIGWGPVTVVVFAFSAQSLMSVGEAKAWRISLAWAAVWIALGQTGVAVNLLPSYLAGPKAHAAALLGFICLVYVARSAATAAAEREVAAAQVRASEQRFRALVQSSSDLISVLGDAGRAIYVSQACRQILGLSEDEARAVDLATLIHPEDRDRLWSAFASIIGGGTTSPLEFRIHHASGEWRHVEAVGTNLRDDPAVGGLVINMRDVTDRKHVEQELAHQAVHDALTGLPNRTLFLDRLGQAIARAERGGGAPAVLFLDLDRFKVVNDSLGHEVGDRLLVETAARLRSAVRPGDTVARFGGDEFVVLCEGPVDAGQVGQRLLQAFVAPFVLDGEAYFMSASVGIAELENLSAGPGDLIRDADTAMYLAKEGGRGRIEVFDDQARQRAVDRVSTEHLLRGAIERDELRLHYQPIIDLATNRVVAAEALLRWEHPHLGLVGPNAFITAAEESGLIVPIGSWVLDAACRRAKSWADAGTPVSVSVNVSPRQLSEDRFPESVATVIASHGLDAAWLGLTLEVTESMLIHDPDRAARRLAALKQVGLRLSMDDFGSGYSSLVYLQRYPFDALKIDRYFVAGIADSERDLAIVRAVIDLAHALDLVVVAEGVETADQLAVLRSLGCDLAQGFHIGAPRPAPAHPADLIREPAAVS